jgi:hypothetical protein
MSGPSPASPPGSPDAKAPRTMRMRNAGILAVASLVVGVGIGAAGAKPVAGDGAAATEAATDAPSVAATLVAEATPTAELTPEPTAGPTLVPTASPTPEPTPEPARPVVVKGKGSQKTKPFDMPGGDFTVTITGNGDGNVIASLNLRGGDVFAGEGLFNEIAHGKYKYETVVYGLDPETYYIDMTNTNAWVVTFTPLA